MKHTAMKHALALTAALLLVHSTPAHAGDDLDGSYFTDGHALVVYGSVAAIAGIALFMEVPDQPRLFDESEGGALYNGNTVPSWAVAGLAGAAGALVIAAPTDARWYHVKGMAEAIGTTALATEFCKRFFGRHRPDYVEGDPDAGVVDGRRSFFSGHASITVATTSYLGLYLHQHLFPAWKPDKGILPWWEAATYAGLLGVTVYVPLSRALDRRHHPSDILTGSAVGLTMSTLFYVWQEQRHRERRGRDEAGVRVPVATGEGSLDLTLVPMSDPAGVFLVGRF
jgi:membrane-associated phospholipid phosphatase